MNPPKLFLSILAVFLLISCGKTIKLEDKDFRWMPYQGKETLLFRCSTGETDTIFLLDPIRSTNPSDPLDLSPTNLEHYTITSRFSEPNPPNGEHRYLEGSFIALSASANRGAFLSISLNAKDAHFYGGDFLKLKDLDTVKLQHLQTYAKTYNDVIILTPGSNEYLQRSDFLTKVYWSKSEGLIRFDKKDSVYWELTKKYN